MYFILFVYVVPAKANPPVRVFSTASQISVQWKPVTEGAVPKKYIVSWRASSDLTSRRRSTSETSWTADSLQSNSKYRFTVRAINYAGKGKPSNEKIFQTGLYTYL